MLTPELPLPHFIERGKDTAISCPLYSGGVVTPPASGTCSVYDGAGALVSSGATANVSDIPTFTVTGVATTDLPLSDSWVVVWEFDGNSPIRNDAYNVRYQLTNTVTTNAITSRLPLLDGASSSLTSRTDWSGLIGEAWIEIQLRLIEEGRRPELVMQPTALRQVTLLKSLQLAFEDLGTRAQDDGALLERAMAYGKKYEAAWGHVTFKYDSDLDGTGDATKSKVGGTVWLF